MAPRSKTREEIEARFVRKGKCLLWTGAQCEGRGQVRIAGKLYLTHRLVWEWNYGPIPDGLKVCHTCDNPLCGEPSHLFLGTQQDNMTDMVQKGRSASGERHSQAILTSLQAKEIRSRISKGERQVSLAAEFGVSRSTVADIQYNRTWVD